ncbi:hypothetical protein MTR67_047809 [Solanum verrucosum]|uniref:Uncharacterized protein n=1 Tax=Solanum verrucosum TaxID=315347 RepID=A0AAF0ZZE3_SOLVR|nr:hypothetical protein MTR67_047809 [Solanum verrucosum]
MSILYHRGKASFVVDSWKMLFMGSTAHVEEGNKELAKEVDRLACLGICLLDSRVGGGVVMNANDSLLESEVNEKQDKDPIFLELKTNVHKQKVMHFEQGGDGVLIC